MDEQREEKRIDVNLQIKYKVENSILGNKTKIQNLSAGGLCMSSFQRLVPGLTLSLSFAIPEFEDEIFLKGQVVWQKEQENVSNLFLLGVKFQNATREIKTHINDFVFGIYP
ncbi:MAG: PilZ domain-containing protein [Candidatus Omnitrophica bacterium]|nr:PilZ domain-containing protein [Candidatus Omnitrophota bacterium]